MHFPSLVGIPRTILSGALPGAPRQPQLDQKGEHFRCPSRLTLRINPVSIQKSNPDRASHRRAAAAAGEPPRAGARARKAGGGTRAQRAGRKGKGKGEQRTEGIATRLPAPADFSRSGFLPRPGAF